MVQRGVQFNLLDELSHHLELLQLLLLHLLKGHQKAGLNVSPQVDLSELALAQHPPQLKPLDYLPF
jgi:hypothetical protein